VVASAQIEQHRPSPETVAQIADHRREQELHSGIDQQKPATIDGCGADIRTGQLFEKSRQNRHDDRNADNVEEQCHKDE